MLRTRKMTPQSKKRLSPTQDRRDVYGQNDKAARQIVPQVIPLRKAKANRALRRGVKTASCGGDEGIDFVAVTPDRGLEWGRWCKCPDTALGDVLHRGPEKHNTRYRARINRKAQRDVH